MTMDKRLHVVLLAMVLTCMSSEAADDKPLVVSKNVDILPTEGVTVEEDIFRDKRYSDNKFCFAEGKTYRNGVTFTLSKLSPCVKYRCEEGTPKIVKEGCYVKQNDRCIQINAMTEIKCITYRCTKRGDKNYTHYKFEPVDPPKCKDEDGVCRSPGDVFPYTIKGRSYPACVCRVTGPTSVRYECHSR